MTEVTKILSIRLNTEDRDALKKYLTRENVEAMLRQIKKGDITITPKGVEFMRVDTVSESVYTDCEDCPYVTDLEMNNFNEACEAKGVDRQKALDRCAQMIWKG